MLQLRFVSTSLTVVTLLHRYRCRTERSFKVRVWLPLLPTLLQQPHLALTAPVAFMPEGLSEPSSVPMKLLRVV